MIKQNIDNDINEIIDEIISIRRCIHMSPELGYEEIQTSKFIAETLKKAGIDTKENVGGNGVVALIKGRNPGKTVLLRADMDALPLTEDTKLEFSSKVPGKMHACGHDIHTSIMIGTALILNKYRDNISGNIKLMFQPAEECSPDGGAKFMIRDGLMENPKVDYAIAVHIMPELEIGQIGLTEGAVTAQSDRFKMKIIGHGGHASAPHRGKDAIVAASNVIMNMQSIIPRMIDPNESAVISVGLISGGEGYNVIPEVVNLDGTARMMTPGCVESVPMLLKQVADNSCAVYGAKCEFEYISGYPILRNDEYITEIVRNVVTENFGSDSIKPFPQCAGGEDFAFVGQHAPAMFIWLGSRTKGSEFIPQHSSKVIFDEECINIGMKCVLLTTEKLLNSASN